MLEYFINVLFTQKLHTISSDMLHTYEVVAIVACRCCRYLIKTLGVIKHTAFNILFQVVLIHAGRMNE